LKLVSRANVELYLYGAWQPFEDDPSLDVRHSPTVVWAEGNPLTAAEAQDYMEQDDAR